MSLNKSQLDSFKELALFDEGTVMTSEYQTSHVFDARLLASLIIHLRNPDSGLTMYYKIQASLDEDLWETIVAESELAPLGAESHMITDPWAYVRLQAKVSPYAPVVKAWSMSTRDNVWTDETTDINDGGTSDVKLPPHSNYPSSRRDYIYYAGSAPFSVMKITVGVKKDYPDNVLMGWDYWNGSAWTRLSNVVDGTNGSRISGADLEVTFDLPGDWAPNVVNGSEELYWIRFGGYANQSSSPPQATQAWVGGATGTIAARMSGKET